MPTPTLIGGFPGQFITIGGQESRHVVRLWNADGTQLRELFSIPRNDVTDVKGLGDGSRFDRVEWSPTGDRILAEVCGWQPSGRLRYRLQCDVYVASADGSEVNRLPVEAGRRSAHWAPDGQHLIYSAESAHGGDDLFLISADAASIQQLTNTKKDDDFPTFSPDGTKILWWTYGGYLRVMNIDGSDNHVIGRAWYGEHEWTPDGTRIVFSAKPHTLSDIYIVGVDRRNKVEITTDRKMDDRHPDVSPDGNLVLYSSYGWPRPGVRDPTWGYYYSVVPLDGSRAPIVIGSGYEARWSVDGKMIFFNGWPAGQGLSLDPRYYAVQPDGTGLVRLPDEAFGFLHGEWQPGSLPQYPGGNVPFTVPTPVPTWTARPTPPIYDDFSAEGVNRTLWAPSTWTNQETDQPVAWSFTQNNGKMVLSSGSARVRRVMNLRLVQPPMRKVEQVAAFEAKLSLRRSSQIDIGARVDAHLRLFASLGPDYLWWTECAIAGTRGRPPSFACGVWKSSNGRTSQEHSSLSIPVHLSRWYTIRIEIDPSSGALQFYLDGELVESYVPEDAARVREATFSPFVGISAYGGRTVTAWVDDVRITD